MSRFDELKKQYPELNISLLDFFNKIDRSKTYKYLPLICKIFGKFVCNYQTKYSYRNEGNHFFSEIVDLLNSKGINTIGMSDNELYMLFLFSEFIPDDFFQTMKQFIDYNEKNKIEKKDITSYSTIDEIRSAVVIAHLKELDKELESQVLKEYEDKTWLIVRPLTFSSSAKYGSCTKWCTTYGTEKSHFERYWRRGILVYVINKVTGYKFAGFKSLDEEIELNLWSADDRRIDLLETEIDDYIYPILVKVFKSKDTNKNLCSAELQEKVHNECIPELKEKIHFYQDHIPNLNYNLSE